MTLIRYSLAKFGGVPPAGAHPLSPAARRYGWFLIERKALQRALVHQAKKGPPGHLDLWRPVNGEGEAAWVATGIALIHDWKGKLPTARFDNDPVWRYLAQTDVPGNETKVGHFVPMESDQPMPHALAETLETRRRWLNEWTTDEVPQMPEEVVMPPAAAAAPLLPPACIYRGDVLREVDCPTCSGKKVSVKVYHCAKRGACNLGQWTKESTGASCRMCKERKTDYPATVEIPFEGYRNAFAGEEGWIIGRGDTVYDPRKLADVTGPIWFINDAVDWERYVAHADTFFIALEWPKFAAWAWRIKSVAMTGFMLQHPHDGVARITRFEHVKGNRNGEDWSAVGPQWPLLDQTDEELASSRRLYQHGSSMLPAIHFAWFCGIRVLNLVGCDCIPQGKHEGREITSTDPREAYNPVLPLTADDGGGRSGGKHPTLRKRHDATAAKLGITLNYIATPPPRE